MVKIFGSWGPPTYVVGSMTRFDGSKATDAPTAPCFRRLIRVLPVGVNRTRDPSANVAVDQLPASQIAGRAESGILGAFAGHPASRELPVKPAGIVRRPPASGIQSARRALGRTPPRPGCPP